MAETTNVALKKIAGSENWRNIFDHYNNSMDIADDEINTIENAIAILASGNTHVAITTGQRVYVRNHDTLASGLYIATADVAANKVLSSSNLEADSAGGLNSLAEDIATNTAVITSQSQAIANVEDGLAIVADGNTHAAVASGQFVYVKNHSSLADGLYKATAAIATNGTLSTSNLAADASGGLNALQSEVSSLNSNMSNIEEFYGTDLHPSINSIYAKKSVRTVTLTIVSKETSEGVDIKAGNTLGKIDKSCVSGRSTLIPVYLYENGKMINGTVWANSSGTLVYYGENITQKMIAFGTYVN